VTSLSEGAAFSRTIAPMRFLPIVAVVTAIGSVAAKPTEPLNVVWTAHDGCPGALELWREIVTRSTKLRRAQTDETAHTAKITIVREADHSVATIVIDAGTERRVSAPTCAEAVGAAAIVTVVALDPDAIATPAPPVSAPTPSTSSSAPIAPAAAVVVPVPVTPPPIVDRSLPPPAPNRSTLVPSLGLAVGAMQAGAGGMITTAVAFDLERLHGERAGSSLRVSLDRGESSFIASERRTGASFTWTTGRLDAMFVPWSLGTTLALRAGIGFEGGALQGKPSGVERPDPRTRLWIAAYALSQLQWQLGTGFAFELEGALGTPYTRDEFMFDPGISVYRPTAVLGRVRLGMLVRFP